MRSTVNQKSYDSIDSGLRGLVHSAERTFLCGAELTPAAIPAGLARIDGSLDGQPLTLCTRRYHGAGFASLTVAAIHCAEQLRTLTVIGLPRRGSPGPVLGMDIIALHGQISLLAIDLSPTDPEFWEAHCRKRLEELAARIDATALVWRKPPAFSAGTFSPLALICGVRAGLEPQVLAALESFLCEVPAITRQAESAAPSPAARDRLTSWLQAEQRNRKEHAALSRMFGAELAARYLDGFLFSTEAAGLCA